MSESLQTFLQSSNGNEVIDAAVRLSSEDDDADIIALISALDDPLEDRRWGAVYALGCRDDHRVINALTRVLLNQQETPRVRSHAAEHLGHRDRNTPLQALIECTTDPSADVRFWCVFSLWSYRRSRNHRARRAAVRALKARLNDHAFPVIAPMGWTVALEALAMLRSQDLASAHSRMFRDTLMIVLKDPVTHPDLWQWATCYWDSLGASPAMTELFDNAIHKLSDAGLDPGAFDCHTHCGQPNTK